MALKQSGTVGDGALRADHHHLSLAIGKAEHQDFGHELADLLGREVDHGGDLTADQELRIWNNP